MAGSNRRPRIELAMARAALDAERERLRDELESLETDERALAVSQRVEGGLAGDAADVASDIAEQEIVNTLGRGTQERLNEIDAALDRIAAGTYGTCEHCAEQIDPARLKARPWARLCLHCQRRSELPRSEVRKSRTRRVA